MNPGHNAYWTTWFIYLLECICYYILSSMITYLIMKNDGWLQNGRPRIGLSQGLEGKNRIKRGSWADTCLQISHSQVSKWDRALATRAILMDFYPQNLRLLSPIKNILTFLKIVLLLFCIIYVMGEFISLYYCVM